MPARRPLPIAVARLRRPLVTGLALFSHLLLVLDVSLPAASPAADGPSFPCRSLRCGCATVEQFLHQCCCFTPEEKAAWARDHRIETPTPSCCQKAPPTDGKRTCCCCSSSCDSTAAPAEPAPPPPVGATWVVGALVHRCLGLGPAWSGDGPVYLPVARLAWSCEWLPAGRAPLISFSAFVVALPPDVPPPRR